GGELGLQAANGEPAAVTGLVVVIETAAVKQGALGRLFLATGEAGRTGHAVEGEGGVGHADVDELPFAGVLAMDDGSENAHDCMMGTASHVGNLDAHGWRPALFTATVAADAGEGEVVNVVAGTVPVWPGLAVTGDRAVDQPGIDGPEG